MINWLSDNLHKIVGVPVISNIATLALVIVQSFSDGVVTDEELHQIVQATNGITLFALTIVLAVLKVKK